MKFLDKLFGGSKREPAVDTPASEDADIDAVFERAAEELSLKTSIAVETWGLGSGGDYSVDLEAGIIRFNNDRGWQISAPVQVIGTYNSQDGSWLWGWDHPSVPAPVSKHAALVRDFGARHGLEVLTTRKVAVEEADAWNFTALACHLACAQGAYRGPTGTTLVFMTFDGVTISKA
ncbi:DUF6882 domain-containing protein [Sphingomonas sp.]|uniref:DUF6882 domain-containing protein n=1 Tax=Sphingomonas sp. TaxID=28214 RepID=UPI001B1A5B8F|nr:DUF6882 domain-containing protein [Sphingomonas sp.]MBO9713996.1 hypothetical protein [Sphingomonas sp.]